MRVCRDQPPSEEQEDVESGSGGTVGHLQHQHFSPLLGDITSHSFLSVSSKYFAVTLHIYPFFIVIPTFSLCHFESWFPDLIQRALTCYDHCLFWGSHCPMCGQGEPFTLLLSPSDISLSFFSPSLLSCTKCSRLILCLPCPSPSIINFPRDLYLLLVKNGI